MRSVAVQQHRGRAPGASSVLGAVVEAAPAAIVGLDLDGDVILWSPIAERMFGWSAADVMGRPPPIIPREDEREFERLIHLLADDVEPIPRRATCVRRDGSRVELASTLVPIRDARQRVVGATWAIFESGLVRSSEASGPGPYRMEALGRFAAGVAHDVNNFLTAISGYAELLAAELPHGSAARADVAEIQRATERTARLTRQLLTFGRRQHQSLEALDIDEVVAGLEPMLQHLAGDGIELVLVRSGGPGMVDADRGQLEQILTSLVVNAHDAMPNGGRITVATAQVTLDEPFVEGHPGASAGPHVRLTVRDTGIGMDEETLAHIFEPYFTTKHAGKGTGLGLATVYGAVKQNGGYILAESALGAGTAMTLYLPRR
jgi:PAS domain S-box-containing protein